MRSRFAIDLLSELPACLIGVVGYGFCGYSFAEKMSEHVCHKRPRDHHQPANFTGATRRTDEKDTATKQYEYGYVVICFLKCKERRWEMCLEEKTSFTYYNSGTSTIETASITSPLHDILPVSF